MSESSGQGRGTGAGRDQGNGSGRGQRSGGSPGDSWESRAAGLASEVQRWLIRTSAKSMRDELGDHVKKAFRGPEMKPGDIWATATTEPPQAAGEAPECAWCPVCRAARRVAEARAAGGESRGAAALADVSDVLTGAVRDVLAGLDSVLSYRPGDLSAARSGSDRPGTTGPGGERAEEPEDEPDHRG